MHDLPQRPETFFGRLSQGVARRLVTNRFYPSQCRYNLTVGSEPKFIWYRVAKTGTRTIFDALRSGGVRFLSENGVFQHYRPAAMHGYFKFAFVRDPVDRFLSCWRDRVLDRNHFGFGSEELVKMRKLAEFVGFAESTDVDRCDVHLRAQCRLIDLGNVDFIGRMERFEEDLRLVLDKLNLRGVRIPWRNASSRDRSGEVIDPALRRRIEKIYERDLRILGYSSDR